MKTLFKTILMAVAIASLSLSAEAQIGSFLKSAKKAVDEAKQVVNDTKDVVKGVGEIVGAEKSSESQTSNESDANKPAAVGNSVNVPKREESTEQAETAKQSPTRQRYQQQEEERARKQAEEEAAAQAAKDAPKVASDGAKMADPNTSNPTIEPGFTKSIADIHAAYDHLGKEQYFDLIPYYEYPEAYYMHTPESKADLDGIYDMMTKGYIARNIYISDFRKVVIYDDELYIPVNELLSNALVALFWGDPTSEEGMMALFRAHVLFNSHYSGVKYAAEDYNAGVINIDKGMFMPKSGSDTWNDAGVRLSRATEYLQKEVPLDDALNVLNKLTKKTLELGAAGEYSDAYTAYEEMQAAYGLIQRHSEGVRDNRKYQIADSQVKRVWQERDKYLQEARKSIIVPIKMPTVTYTMDARTTQGGSNYAKSVYGARFEKLIFLEKDWRPFKDTHYPYGIIFRGINVGIIVKEDGKYYLEKAVLKENGNGSNWSGKYSFGSTMETIIGKQMLTDYK